MKIRLDGFSRIQPLDISRWRRRCYIQRLGQRCNGGILGFCLFQTKIRWLRRLLAACLQEVFIFNLHRSLHEQPSPLHPTFPSSNGSSQHPYPLHSLDPPLAVADSPAVYSTLQNYTTFHSPLNPSDTLDTDTLDVWTPQLESPFQLHRPCLDWRDREGVWC